MIKDMLWDDRGSWLCGFLAAGGLWMLLVTGGLPL